MSWLSKQFRSVNFKEPSELYREGTAQFDYGRKLTEEGLGGLRGLASQFQAQLDGGALTPELQRTFAVARGALSDQYARSGRALRQALEARRMQSQGALTPGAIAELEKEHEVTANEDYFAASNDLAHEKAALTYTATTDLFDRLTNIKDTIRTTGLTQEQQALMAKLQAALMKLERRKAIASTAASIYGMSKGGGAAPSGGPSYSFGAGFQ